MSTALFDLDDFEETRVEWVPMYKPFGITLASLIVPDRCRDCGARMQHMHQGGSALGVGSFFVCDECAMVDDCVSAKFLGDETHVSKWGMAHAAQDHDDLIKRRESRRDAYRRRALKAVA